MSSLKKCLLKLTVTAFVLMATVRHSLGTVNLCEHFTAEDDFDTTHPLFLAMIFTLMLVGYYPFAKERTEGGLKDAHALMVCKQDAPVSPQKNGLALGLSVAFVAAQIALVDQNPIRLLAPHPALNLAIAMGSSIGMMPSAYNTIMRIFARGETGQAGGAEKLVNWTAGGSWSLIGAYASMSAVVRLLAKIDYARYPAAIVISAPAVMLNYDTYLSLKKMWKAEAEAGASSKAILSQAARYFGHHLGSFLLAFLNVIPQIGFALVTVSKDIENPALRICTLSLVLLSNVTSNWFMRGRAAVEWAKKVECPCAPRPFHRLTEMSSGQAVPGLVVVSAQA